MQNNTFVLASNNLGKFNEFNRLFTRVNVSIEPQKKYQIPEAEETGLSFVENAIIKARNAAAHAGMPSIADDSGLEVDALNGAPGIYSARFSQDEYGVATNDKSNNKKLLDLLVGVPEAARTARFVCALAFMKHAEDPRPILSVGVWEGIILNKEVGDHGFGYDPVFFVPEFACVSAQLDPEIKNQHSHRGKAMQDMFKQLSELGIISAR